MQYKSKKNYYQDATITNTINNKEYTFDKKCVCLNP